MSMRQVQLDDLPQNCNHLQGDPGRVATAVTAPVKLVERQTWFELQAGRPPAVAELDETERDPIILVRRLA